jgi:isoquinoline 1-oxidoreductase
MTQKDDYMEIDFYDNDPLLPLDRRQFLKAVGGGIFILFFVGESPDLLSQQRRRRSRPQMPEDFNAYLRITETGRVECFTGKIEMGQGVVTSLSQQIADELEVPLDSVDMVMGDTDRCPWDMGTFGSMTTRFFSPYLRAAAAKARMVLIQLAAEHMGTKPSNLAAKDGKVFVKSQKEKTVSYGQLAKGKKITRQLKENAVLEKFKDFSIVGTPVSRVDGEEKVTGSAKFAGDFKEPGMLYARILRPPAHDAKMISIDTSGIRKIKGARLAKPDDLIAVLHEDPELADAALKEIKVKFDKPDSNIDHNTIFDHLLKVAPEGEVAAGGGELDKGKEMSKTVIEHTYLDGYVAHAPIEPHTAMAKIEGDRVIIRASTQTPFRLKTEAAEALGIPAKKVRIIPPFVGGGYGGKTSNQQAVEAVKLAKLTGKPVMVAWTRAEEFFYDRLRPAAVVKIKAGVTDKGKISMWDYGVYFAGQRGSIHYYDIPHHRTMTFNSSWRGAPGTHPFPTGAWRAPANNTNTFARESHIDILAAAAGMDPLEFRLRNLKDEKMRGVLKEVAKLFGWTPAKKSPSGRGYGIATGIDAGTYVAHMAEVEVDKKTGHVQVKRVACAQDMGLCINPEGAKNQMEGCIMMGLGYTLTEEILFKGAEMFTLNFDNYEIPKFSWLPKIDTAIVGDKNKPPQGGGEPAIIAMGGVIANAIYDACGARLFQMPMTPERIKEALKG